MRCGVKVIPKNLMVFVFSKELDGFPLMFRLRLVCLFEGFLNSMYFVLTGFFDFEPITPIYEFIK